MFKNVALYFGLFLTAATVNASDNILDDVQIDGLKYGITGLQYEVGSSVDEVKLEFEAEYPEETGYYAEGGRNLRGGPSTTAKQVEERKMVQWVPKDAIKIVPVDELTRERNLQDEDGTADGGYSYGGSSGYVVAAYGVDDAAIGASLEVEIKYQSPPSYDDED